LISKQAAARGASPAMVLNRSAALNLPVAAHFTKASSPAFNDRAVTCSNCLAAPLASSA